MATLDSFAPLLAWVCRELKPKRILEWGPGLSTQQMAEALPEAEILTLEHDPTYMPATVKRLAPYSNVHLVLRRLTGAPGQAEFQNEGYVTWPLMDLRLCGATWPYYDFVFIDGGDRVDCLVTAHLLVKTGGLVVMHDGDRPELQRHLAFFEHHAYTADKTSVLMAKTRTPLERCPLVESLR